MATRIDSAAGRAPASGRVGLAILGCGYVANMYRLTLPAHPGLELRGVHDRERSRGEAMARLTGVRHYPDLDALLDDGTVAIVANLTNPSEHHATTTRLLEAGKHVYTEKPLAMRLDHARALAALAEARGLHLVSAPTTLMGPVAQTLWRAARDGRAGRVRLVHAAMEDGMVPRAPVHRWVNEAGTPWPAVDEYATGCTVEHAGYVLSWLCAMFGPVVRLTAHAEELMPDKVEGLALPATPDLSVATLRFGDGTVARMTNGLYAGHDHALTLWGDEGALAVDDPRSDVSPVRLARYRTVRRRRFLGRARRLPPLGPAERIARYRGSQTRDFCRALADMAAALTEGRAPYTGGAFAAHLAEVTLACHHGTHPSGERAGFDGRLRTMPYETVTRFPAVEPLAWAR